LNHLLLLSFLTHLNSSFVKQMSLAHMVQRFLPWLCSVQKKCHGSIAHGNPGSSNVLQWQQQQQQQHELLSFAVQESHIGDIAVM
jgi:hypothetical protein